MDGTDDRLLSALRRMRAIETDARGLGERLLEVVVSATASTSATLHRPLAGAEDIRVGANDDVAVERIERRFSDSSGVAVLALERPARAFDDSDATMLEVLGGEVLSRLERAHAAVETDRLRRQIELLRALWSTNEGALRPRDIADRAASELVGAFAGAHVLVHAVVGDHLELIVRRTEAGRRVAEVPNWGHRLPIDGPMAMAVAAREKRMVSRPTCEVEEPRRSFLEGMGIRHMVAMPLSFDDVVLGTLTVAHREDAPFDSESLRLFESVTAQLAFELAHARLLEAERRRADDLGLINELGGLVAQHLELRAVLTTAARALVRVLGVSRVHVILSDDAKMHLRGVAATDDGVSDLELAVSSSHAVAHAFRTLAPVIIEHAETDSRTNKELVAQVGTRSLAIVPLIARGEAIGVIVVLETSHTRHFTETDVARVVAVANVIAPAVTNAKMFEDLRRSYEALAKAQADLVTHERLAALGELSAVIAHEVRNPLAVIFNSLSELRRLAPPVPEASLLLDIVGEETKRLNRIVGDLLDFVRPYDAHPRLVDVGAVVKGAADAARRASPEPRVDIETEVRLPAPELFLDGTMLHQALLNLIVNAIQATPEGKRVTVRADVVPAAGGQQRLRCEIADEGPGIDEAASARIFQPFFTTKATGTGLGLALVRRLADALGGTIVAETRPTCGALFTLTLPLSPEAEPTGG